MTPNQLIERLKVPQNKLDRIKALAGSLDDLEKILQEDGGEHHNADTPFQQGILTQAQNCVNLIARILHENPNDVLNALLLLFGLTEEQFKSGHTSTSKIITLSAWVTTHQP